MAETAATDKGGDTNHTLGVQAPPPVAQEETALNLSSELLNRRGKKNLLSPSLAPNPPPKGTRADEIVVLLGNSDEYSYCGDDLTLLPGDGKVAHGSGLCRYSWGTYQGGFHHGKRHGYGRCKYVSEDDSDSQYEGGDLFYNVNETYEGDWKRNLRHGQGTYTYTVGRKYVGKWRNDLKHGEGSEIYEDGATYTGQFRNGKRHGRGVYTWPDGSQYDGDWKDGEIHALTRTNTSSGDDTDDAVPPAQEEENDGDDNDDDSTLYVIDLSNFVPSSGTHDYDDDDISSLGMESLGRIPLQRPVDIVVCLGGNDEEEKHDNDGNNNDDDGTWYVADVSNFEPSSGTHDHDDDDMSSLGIESLVVIPVQRPDDTVVCLGGNDDEEKHDSDGDNNDDDGTWYVADVSNFEPSSGTQDYDDDDMSSLGIDSLVVIPVQRPDDIVVRPGENDEEEKHDNDGDSNDDEGTWYVIDVSNFEPSSCTYDYDNDGMSSIGMESLVVIPAQRPDDIVVRPGENDDEYIYNGDATDGLAHGEGRCRYRYGIYEGEFFRGKRHGQGKYKYFNEDSTWIGCSDSNAFTTDDNTYEGEWSYNFHHGEGTFTYTTGSSYGGEWDRDLKQGEGSEVYDDASTYIGRFERGRRNGHGVYEWPDGGLYRGRFMNDEIHSSVTRTNSPTLGNHSAVLRKTALLEEEEHATQQQFLNNL